MKLNFERILAPIEIKVAADGIAAAVSVIFF